MTSTLTTGLARTLASVRWYVRAVVGADAYEVYVARQARLHPGQPVLGARQFWRAHTDSQQVAPGQRCC